MDPEVKERYALLSGNKLTLSGKPCLKRCSFKSI